MHRSFCTPVNDALVTITVKHYKRVSFFCYELPVPVLGFQEISRPFSSMLHVHVMLQHTKTIRCCQVCRNRSGKEHLCMWWTGDTTVVSNDLICPVRRSLLCTSATLTAVQAAWQFIGLDIIALVLISHHFYNNSKLTGVCMTDTRWQIIWRIAVMLGDVM